MSARNVIASVMEIEISKARSVLYTDTCTACVHYENVKMLSSILNMIDNFEYNLVSDESELACVD
jgi:hypothetical protein